MNHKRLLSVGIDVGTTTTQVIFSALEVINRAPVNQVPRYEFSRRDVIYQSPVIFTPLTSGREVDVEPLLAFIDGQYAAAGVDRRQVESGVIIITGETSKARNARPALMAVADALGDFVVATAGPHLESVISGRGSGATEYSRQHAARVMNIDIGGGTSNYAVFAAGRTIDSACLNVGGRLLERAADGRVSRVHEPARRICAELWGAGQDPLRLDPAQVERLVERMAGLVVEIIQGKPSALAESLLMTEPLREIGGIDAIAISGGVGTCLYDPATAGGDNAYGDIGPQLARALGALLRQPGGPKLIEPQQTVRATVIGAGAHTLALSGSTIWVNAAGLPLRNLPVAQPSQAEAAGLCAAWQTALRHLDLDAGRDAYVLALPPEIAPLYRQIVAVAAELSQFCHAAAGANPHPLVVICRQDIGKALGMELQPLIGRRELAVIDEVETKEGDYLDIGLPIFNGNLVPITVKSLAFPS